MHAYDEVLAHLELATANYPEPLRRRALGNLRALLAKSSLPFALEPRGFIDTGVQCALQVDGREYSYLLIIKTDQGGLKVEAHGDIRQSLLRHRPMLGRLAASIGAQVVVDATPDSKRYLGVRLTELHGTSSQDAEQDQVIAFLSRIAEILSADGITPCTDVSGAHVAAAPSLTTEQLAAESTLDALEELDLPSQAKRRAEQGLLRTLRLEHRAEAPCDLCGNSYSSDLLVLAHIKDRSQCDDSERRDYRNNTMLACTFGCDELFERHYLEVRDGVCVRGTRRATTEVVRQRIERLCGKKCTAWSSKSTAYFRWHEERGG